MTRKKALEALEKLRRIEQLEMQLDQLKYWALNETTSDILDVKEAPFPSYIYVELFTENDIEELISIVRHKLNKALDELEKL